jgi:hypothetical protein
MSRLNRRSFLQLATAAAVTTSLRAQTPAKASFTIGNEPLATMPLDFTGLSYESPQLCNPAFFSPANTGLIQLFRELGPTGGVLRLGGNLSAFTAWHDEPNSPITATEQTFLDKGKHYWEWDLTDPTVRHGNHEAVFTPASIETLAGFLQATGWRLLYGLNFATGTPEQAAAEAAFVQRLCGKNLIGFQLGNEIDFWGGGFRPKPWEFDQYYSEWRKWVAIIRATVPNAPMAGPDTAIRLDWMEQLAEQERNNIVLLTKHHYAMGPAGDPRMDAHHLFGPDPDAAKEIAAAQRAKTFAGVGFRTAECNSCFHGGQPGVSNAYASALWGADYMLTLAQGGHAGVNLHGGGDGIYSPITGDADRGFIRQPLYFGMKFAQTFAGATLLEGTLTSSANLTAYAAKHNEQLLIALINKDSSPVTVECSAPHLNKANLVESNKLSAPALDSKTDVTFAPVNLVNAVRHTRKSVVYDVQPYTAILLRFNTTATS